MQTVKRTRMVKKFRPKPGAARPIPPPRQIQFNQQAELQIPQAMNFAPAGGGPPAAAASQLATGPVPYKGREVDENATGDLLLYHVGAMPF